MENHKAEFVGPNTVEGFLNFFDMVQIVMFQIYYNVAKLEN
jgi:hypothetical protein